LLGFTDIPAVLNKSNLHVIP